MLMYSPKEESYVFQKLLTPAGIDPILRQVQLTEAILEMVRAGLGITALGRWWRSRTRSAIACRRSADAGRVLPAVAGGRSARARGHRLRQRVPAPGGLARSGGQNRRDTAAYCAPSARPASITAPQHCSTGGLQHCSTVALQHRASLQSAPMSGAPINRRAVALAVLVAALGYFVDIYDLILFSIVRVPSLRAIGVAQDQIFSTGVMLLNMQMSGMLIGGIVWGVLGDKRGRLSVLFGTIILYSLANLANAWVTTVPQYAALRLIAGIGLAGELGAGITLVSELMPKESRGYATSLVSAIGICGAVAAFAVGQRFDWRTAYIVGGVMGLALLLLRVGVRESGLFVQAQASDHPRGQFFKLFSTWHRASRYIASILVGVPIWYDRGDPHHLLARDRQGHWPEPGARGRTAPSSTATSASRSVGCSAAGCRNGSAAGRRSSRCSWG